MVITDIETAEQLIAELKEKNENIVSIEPLQTGKTTQWLHFLQAVEENQIQVTLFNYPGMLNASLKDDMDLRRLLTALKIPCKWKRH